MQGILALGVAFCKKAKTPRFVVTIMNADSKMATDRVGTIVDNLERPISDEAREKALELAERAEMEHPINRRPSSVAAASVYFACLLVNEKRTQAEVTAVSDAGHNGLREAMYDIARAEGYPIERKSRNDSDEPKPSLLTILKDGFREFLHG